MTKSTLQKIREMLTDRSDIALLDSGDDRIQGCQLRRVYKYEQIGRGFQHVDTYNFAYHGQAFVIEEPRYLKRKDGEKELCAEQRQLTTELGRVGGVVIFATSIDDVIDALGPEPQNVAEYLERRVK